MPIKFTAKCTRCRREDELNVQGMEEATAIEANLAKRQESAKRLEEFVNTIPENERPDVFAIFGGKVVVHSYLCDPGENQRSCSERVHALIEDVNTLPERKARAKKSDPVTP